MVRFSPLFLILWGTVLQYTAGGGLLYNFFFVGAPPY